MRFFAAGNLNGCKIRAGRVRDVVLISSVLTADAQVSDPGTPPERGPAAQAQSSALVSANELRAPRDAKTAAHLGRMALEQRRYPDARRHIAHALEIYPEYALALQLRGVLNLREQRLEAACTDFQRATEYDPNLGAA